MLFNFKIRKKIFSQEKLICSIIELYVQKYELINNKLI